MLMALKETIYVYSKHRKHGIIWFYSFIAISWLDANIETSSAYSCSFTAVCEHLQAGPWCFTELQGFAKILEDLVGKMYLPATDHV